MRVARGEHVSGPRVEVVHAGRDDPGGYRHRDDQREQDRVRRRELEAALLLGGRRLGLLAHDGLLSGASPVTDVGEAGGSISARWPPSAQELLRDGVRDVERTYVVAVVVVRAAGPPQQTEDGQDQHENHDQSALRIPCCISVSRLLYFLPCNLIIGVTNYFYKLSWL